MNSEDYREPLDRSLKAEDNTYNMQLYLGMQKNGFRNGFRKLLYQFMKENSPRSNKCKDEDTHLAYDIWLMMS